MSNKIQNRVKKIEDITFKVVPKCVTITMKNDETQDESLERYFKECPEDRGALNFYILTSGLSNL